MTNADKIEFAELMTMLAQIYGTELNPVMLDTYFRLLAEYSAEDVRAAAEAHAKDPDRGVFFPRPADIIAQLRGKSVQRAVVAWEGIMEALTLNRWDSPNLNPAAKRALQAIGGSAAIRNGKESDQGFLFKRFAEFFSVFDKPEINNVIKIDFTNIKRLTS